MPSGDSCTLSILGLILVVLGDSVKHLRKAKDLCPSVFVAPCIETRLEELYMIGEIVSALIETRILLGGGVSPSMEFA